MEQRSRVWALMQRIELCRHRATLAEAKTASGSTAFNVEMAEIAQEWRDLARQIEVEAFAEPSSTRTAGEEEAASRNVSAAQSERVGGLRRWPGELVVGLVIGTLVAFTLAKPQWVEASTGSTSTAGPARSSGP
jgi:hypothetical protein